MNLQRISEGLLRLDPRPFELRAYLGELSDIYASSLRARHLHFGLAVDSRLPPSLLADRHRIRQVCQWLIVACVHLLQGFQQSCQIFEFVFFSGVDKLCDQCGQVHS
jgi:hypothetical protein